MTADNSVREKRPLQFGLGPAGLGDLHSARAWRELARRVEDLGYTSLCLGEHIDARPAPGPLTVALASWTTRLRVAVHMYAADFHNPTILVRELSTIALLTEGRFDAGVGAGWLAKDYEHLGLPFDPPRVRIDRLRETAELLRAAWTNDVVTTAGTHVHVSDLVGRPLLGDAVAPNLVMGGGGRQMLTVAARMADIVSINVRLESGRLGPERGQTATRVAAAEKLRTVRGAAGERFDRLLLQLELHHVEVTHDRTAALERAAQELGMPLPEAETSPHVLVGTVDEIGERLIQLREELGVSYFCLSAAAADAFAPVVRALAGK
jgi:probable F420-dependent oxidoreductase